MFTPWTKLEQKNTEKEIKKIRYSLTGGFVEQTEMTPDTKCWDDKV